MQKNNNNLHRAAMLFGTYMGIFWIIKFVFFPLGMSTPIFLLTFGILSCYVPFLGYRFTRTYRNTITGGTISFAHAWAFTTLMFTYASMLTAVCHFVYFRFIDNGFILQAYQSIINNNAMKDVQGMDGYLSEMQTLLDTFKSLSTTDIVMQLLSQNIFYGAITAIIIAAIAQKKNIKQN